MTTILFLFRWYKITIIWCQNKIFWQYKKACFHFLIFIFLNTAHNNNIVHLFKNILISLVVIHLYITFASDLQKVD